MTARSRWCHTAGEQELNAEKDELDQFMKLDRRRKIAEYTYYDKELRRAKAELEKMESQRGNE